MNELVRDLAPRYVLTKFDRNRRRIAPGRALTGLTGYRRTDGQTDNLIPVYPRFNFVERGYNDGILLIRPLGTNFSEISIEIYIFSYKKMRSKMSSGKWQPFCLGLNVLKNRASVDLRCHKAHKESLSWLWCIPAWTQTGWLVEWGQQRR